MLKIVILGSATRVINHSQFPPVTNCEQLFLTQVHLMVSILLGEIQPHFYLSLA